MSFSRYRRLDGMAVLQGSITHVDPERKRVAVHPREGAERELDYDALVISSGVTNGFWRTAAVEDAAAIDRRIDADAERLAKASRVAVLGGGATGVSAASNLKDDWPAHPPRRRRSLGHRKATPEHPIRSVPDARSRRLREGGPPASRAGHRRRVRGRRRRGVRPQSLLGSQRRSPRRRA